MKRLMFIVMVAGAVSVFAAANDPLIPAHVEEGRTYALLCKGELVRNYMANATMDMNFQGNAELSADPADYEVVQVEDFEIGSVVCTYPDGGTLPAGERLLLVKCAKGTGFKGLTWDYELIDSANDAIVNAYTSDDSGKFNVGDLSALDPDFDYAFIVLDTRLVDGTPSAADKTTNPKVVGGWGEFVTADGTAATASIRWTQVKMGLAESYPVSGLELDFDPTLVLEKGFATISPSEGEWRIYQLPEAWVASLENPTLTKGDNYHHLRAETAVPASFTLESAYKFSAFDTALEPIALKFLKNETLTSGEQAIVDAWYNQVSPFWQWNADFEVSFDREVEADSVILAGWYDYTSAWSDKYSFGWSGTPWVGSSPWEKFVPGESKPIRLLQSYVGENGEITMTYGEICQKVIQFLCGVKNLSEKNYGTTMTVKLCIYENTGRCHESGRRIEIGTYDYTFRGPLKVMFKSGLNAPEDEELPDGFTTNYDGKVAIKLPVPAYDAASHSNLTFVGWSNKVDLVDLVYVPANTWGDFELWSTWKTAKTVVIKPDTNETATAGIKVADEWIEKNLKDVPEDEIAEALQKPAEDGGKIPLWQTYVLGLNPSGTVEVVSTEKLSDDKALVVSTVEAPPPDSGFKVTYSLDKIESDEEVVKKGAEQVTKDIAIELEPESGETPTGYYKMNVFITPEENGQPVEDEKVWVKSEVTVGVLTVASEEKVVPVAVPWQSLADIKEDIPVNEIVQTQGLTEGDTLSVYDQEKKVYNTFVLSLGEWKPTTAYTIDSNGAKQVVPGTAPATVKRGSGMWLNRQNTDKPFHLFGQYEKAGATTTITPPAQDATKPEYNLIAPTGINPVTDLNAMPSMKSDEVSEKDQLMILRNGVPTYMRFKKGEGWGYYKSSVDPQTGRLVKTWTTDDAKVDAGTGLWYISAGGKPTIDWSEGENQDSAQ